MNKAFITILIGVVFLFVGCNAPATTEEPRSTVLNEQARIVSLNGTITEILMELGAGDRLVAVDVTSTYPAALDSLPRLGHSRNATVEGLLNFAPTIIIGMKKDLKPELLEQLKSTGVKLMLFDHEYSFEGTKKLIAEIAQGLDLVAEGDEMLTALDAEIAQVKTASPTGEEQAPTVLFIYARGTGTLMVSGEGTPIEQMISLAGGKNAAVGFKDYKPLTAESLINADPDVFLLFDSGLESLGGIDGLLAIPGVKETRAGKNQRVIEMDGQLLAGFGPRLGQAVNELSTKIKSAVQ